MKLYLVRHGDAVASIPDVERSLSSLGLQQVDALAQFLVERKAPPMIIYHSGIVRAQQTAKIIGHELHIAAVEKIPGLRPNDSPEDMLVNIEIWSQDTMLVGHLPFMDILLILLVKDVRNIMFYPTTTVCLVGEGENWQIEWVYNP